MKVLYDHQIFSLQKYGGISRYFFELMKQFSKMDGISYDLALLYTRNFYLLSNPELFNNVQKDIKTDEFCYGLQFVGKAKLHKFLGRMSLVDHPMFNNLKVSYNFLNKSEYNIFHPSYYDNYFIDKIKKPYVLTVHDMMYEIYANKYYNNTNGFIEKKKELINKAAHIIAISENTKKDIINICNIEDKKISVVYHGNSFNYIPSKKIDSEIPERYILYVGDRKVYKNYEFFVNSIKSLLLKDKNLFLVCAGSVKFNSKEKFFLYRHGLTKKVIHFPLIDDEKLIDIYNRALCFVFPTLYEGFGIPILEAFSCGCPAVLSCSSSLPEVGGNAALYFDPKNTESILETVKSVIYNKDLAEKLRKRGFEQVKKFSWEKCAIETKKVYESVI